VCEAIEVFQGCSIARSTTVDAVTSLLTGRRAVVFAGAGISRDSGLPVANDLTDEILQRLQMSPAGKRALAEARPPFELFIETLAGCSDITALYQIYQAGAPCLLHHYCVQQARSSLLSAVVTTNFDQLFELALDESGIDYE
jgi:NAD-dependent SIR2 family protein deacetylase